jgi:oligogalacturonide transport system permease protein
MEVDLKTLERHSQAGGTAWRKSLRNNRNIGLVFISPWLIGFFVFQLYPFVASLVYSFTTYKIIERPRFIGLENYIRLFTKDPVFLNSLKVTFQYLLMSVPSKLIFALIVAVILNRKIRGINFYRTIYYLPSILGGSVAISVLWKLLFMHSGVLNTILKRFNIESIQWMGPKSALFIISILQVWQFGSSMVIFLAALKQVPRDILEAAKVDGASAFRIFFRVTLPMISSIIFFNLLMQTINVMQNFTSAFVVTNGGPAKATYVIGMMLYEEGFKYFQMGYASAASWVLFSIILIMTVIIFMSSDRWVYYEDGGKTF